MPRQRGKRIDWGGLSGMGKIPVTMRLKALRERSGLPMADVAKAAGYKTASGYQRYEDPDMFTKKYLPLELVEALTPLFAGKGEPPIDSDEVMSLAGSLASDGMASLASEIRGLPPAKQREVWDVLLHVVRGYKVDLKS